MGLVKVYYEHREGGHELVNFERDLRTHQEAVETLQESFLAISIDGKYAVSGPETYIDSRTYYAAK